MQQAIWALNEYPVEAVLEKAALEGSDSCTKSRVSGKQEKQRKEQWIIWIPVTLLFIIIMMTTSGSSFLGPKEVASGSG